MAEPMFAGTMPDSTPINRLVRKARHLLRASWVATGLGLSAGLFLAALTVTTTIDMLAPFWWPALRLTALLLVVVPAAWAFFTGVVRPTLRRLPAARVARRVETHIPGIHNRLVSCIDLAKSRPAQTASPAFYRRLVTEAIERIRNFRPGTVVDWLSLRRAMLFAGGSVAALAVLWLIVSDRLPTAVARIFLPFADIPPVSGVAYAVEPGTADVLRDEEIAFSVQVTKGQPEKLYLERKSDDGSEQGREELRSADGQTWKLVLVGLKQSFAYRVHGGGTWSKQFRINLVDRPVIGEWHVALHYPGYMRIPEPRVGPPQTLEVTGPEQSEVEVVVKAEGQVAEGEIQHLKLGKRKGPASDRLDRVWFEGSVPAGALAEGTWQWDTQTHGRPAHTEPPSIGTHGHWFQGAATGLNVQPGEGLFAYVYLVPDHKPEAIMLEWNDGSGWEHRVYWGADLIKKGQANTAGRRHLGPLPEAGKWVRLEVPADLVNLDGKSLRGMAFTLHGGQAYWAKAGVAEQELIPDKTFALKRTGDNEWSGRFPLLGSGLYRVELRNHLGHPNKPMKEAKFLALPDNPPHHLVLQRPGTNLVLSKPDKVSLVVEAEDDYGIAEVAIAIQKGDTGGFTNRPLKRYTKAQRSDTVLSMLDLNELGVKVGEHIRYRIEARDHNPKGKVTATPEYVIRVAADNNAADQQLAQFEKGQDPFREKLVKLIAEQAKVKDAVEKLAAKYEPVDKKVKEAQAKIEAQKEQTPNDPAKPQPAPPPLQLDPETAKQLLELQKELAKLAQEEQKNAELAKQLDAELAKMAEQAGKLDLMPKELADQMKALQQAFQQQAVKPLENLAQRMAQATNPKAPPPDVKQMQKQTDRVQQDLKRLQDRLDALAEARKDMRQDLQMALDKLQQQMMQQRGQLTARELEELRDFIAKLREQLKDLEGQQDKLAKATKEAPDKLIPDLEKHQKEMDKDADKALAKAKDLQDQERLKRMRRKPQFPDQPFMDDGDEEKMPPREQDTDEPDKPKKDNKGAKGKTDAKKEKGEKKDADKEEEPLFMPALGGPKQRMDKRFADKVRPTEKKKKADSDAEPTPPSPREQLQERQAQRMNELNQANQSLGVDQQTLERIMRQLMNAMKGKGQPGEPTDDDAADALAQMLQSPDIQQALQMAQRMRTAGQSQSQQAQGPRQPPPPNQAAVGNLTGSPITGRAADAELAKLDLATRSMVLKLPPRVREELLLGMREEGPEGYRKFIQDYFKRLTEVNGNPK